ncbi:hypothetical protein PFISCL1PPCAC_26018, partial [Pristionchus fissidentatus]
FSRLAMAEASDSQGELSSLSRENERLKKDIEELRSQALEKAVAFTESVHDEVVTYKGGFSTITSNSLVKKSFKVGDMDFSVEARSKNGCVEILTTVKSESNYRLAVITHVEGKDPYSNEAKQTSPQIIYIRSGVYDLQTVATRPGLRNGAVIDLNIRMKIFWGPCENAVERGLAGEDVTVVVEEKVFEVNATYLSHWSHFLRAYFNSNMRESREGRYPIEKCTAEDIRELLTVIYPCGKSIDSRNVENLLDLADRFIMPFVTHMCEVFLIDRAKHELTTIKILQLAEQYNLVYTKAIIIECLTSADEIRKGVMRAEGYKELEPHTKKCIEAQYIEVDLRNNP